MIPPPASIVRLFGRSRTSAHIDAAFVAQVREHLEPVLAAAGFAVVAPESVTARRRRSTVVRYLADPVVFVRRFPGAGRVLRTEGEPLEFWIACEAGTGTVRSELEGFEPAALLAAVRAGPGAPPRRRHVDAPPARSCAESVERDGDILTRFLDVVATG